MPLAASTPILTRSFQSMSTAGSWSTWYSDPRSRNSVMRHMPLASRQAPMNSVTLGWRSLDMISTSALNSSSALAERFWSRSFLMATSVPRQTPLNTSPKAPRPMNLPNSRSAISISHSRRAGAAAALAAKPASKAAIAGHETSRAAWPVAFVTVMLAPRPTRYSATFSLRQKHA
eukprot:Amastigsp_a678889_46.p4 type:complete len:175 gc:universal Amastigsp_a678889_46:862-338(-)